MEKHYIKTEKLYLVKSIINFTNDFLDKSDPNIPDSHKDEIRDWIITRLLAFRDKLIDSEVTPD